MQTTAQVNYARIVEGNCWDCGKPLERILDWGECFTCNRRFTVRGRDVIEQIALPPDVYGAKRLQLGGTLISSNGKVVGPMEDGTYEISEIGMWVECQWSVA